MGHSRPLFLHFRLFYCTIDRLCLCQNSNCGSLVLEATALPPCHKHCPKQALLSPFRTERCLKMSSSYPIKIPCFKTNHDNSSSTTLCTTELVCNFQHYSFFAINVLKSLTQQKVSLYNCPLDMFLFTTDNKTGLQAKYPSPV